MNTELRICFLDTDDRFTTVVNKPNTLTELQTSLLPFIHCISGLQYTTAGQLRLLYYGIPVNESNFACLRHMDNIQVVVYETKNKCTTIAKDAIEDIEMSHVNDKTSETHQYTVQEIDFLMDCLSDIQDTHEAEKPQKAYNTSYKPIHQIPTNMSSNGSSLHLAYQNRILKRKLEMIETGKIKITQKQTSAATHPFALWDQALLKNHEDNPPNKHNLHADGIKRLKPNTTQNYTVSNYPLCLGRS